MKITNLDHMVLTVTNLNKSRKFYQDILNLDFIESNNGSYNFKVGSSLIKMRTQTNESDSIVAANLEPGAFDFCLETATPLQDVMDELNEKHIPIELGPVKRHGVKGIMHSVYVRDPDKNLVEICSYN
ncbi:MAG: virulence protein [Lactobacillus sp.]|nr:virulence protein [Lactobacillus sp.]